MFQFQYKIKGIVHPEITILSSNLFLPAVEEYWELDFHYVSWKSIATSTSLSCVQQIKSHKGLETFAGEYIFKLEVTFKSNTVYYNLESLFFQDT